MSIRAATAKVSSTIRRVLRATFNWRGEDDSANADDNGYTSAFWVALLLIVGLVVKHVR